MDIIHVDTLPGVSFIGHLGHPVGILRDGWGLDGLFLPVVRIISLEYMKIQCNI